MIAGASAMPVGTPYDDATNPQILRGVRGLAVEGIAMHEHFVALSYRANGLPKLAVMSKQQAAQDFLARRPWQFAEVNVPELDGDWDGASDDAAVNPPQLKDFEGSSARLYSIGTAGNPSYEAPRMRYMVTGYTRPGELREFDPRTGEDVLLKRANVLGSFDARDYVERRIWVQVRDGEQVPVSLVWRRDCVRGRMPMFVIGYGAYEISSDPAFSVSRLSMLDRGVLYVVPHVRGGGEMGRAWYEMGRRRNKKHTFEDFIDVTAAIQDCGLADRARTVANGGSAGGLLMGAVANMAPERFAGIEADVPFVDALTTILDPTLPLTVTEWDEWGDPLHDAETYRYMKTYTPYENAPAAGRGRRAVAGRHAGDGVPEDLRDHVDERLACDGGGAAQMGGAAAGRGSGRDHQDRGRGRSRRHQRALRAVEADLLRERVGACRHGHRRVRRAVPVRVGADCSGVIPGIISPLISPSISLCETFAPKRPRTENRAKAASASG